MSMAINNFVAGQTKLYHRCIVVLGSEGVRYAKSMSRGQSSYSLLSKCIGVRRAQSCTVVQLTPPCVADNSLKARSVAGGSGWWWLGSLIANNNQNEQQSTLWLLLMYSILANTSWLWALGMSCRS